MYLKLLAPQKTELLLSAFQESSEAPPIRNELGK